MKTNVLIVEDCSVMRLMIKRVLNLSDIELGTIFEAENGEEGLKLLESKNIGLLILDMYMPVMDGMEFMEVVKSKTDIKDIPIIVVSSESNEKRIESLSNLGSGFVHKPFTPEDLSAEIFKVALEENVPIKKV